MRNSQIEVEGVAWAIRQSDELMSLYDITSSVSPSMKLFLIISLDFVSLYTAGATLRDQN
jgi:hypothetical protein